MRTTRERERLIVVFQWDQLIGKTCKHHQRVSSALGTLS